MSENNEKKDRVAKYLTVLNKDMLFEELSDSFLKKIGAYDILKGVPIPVGMSRDEEITTLSIAHNMGRVIGGDPDFPYQSQYLDFLNLIFGDNADKAMISEGAKYGSQGDYEVACMFFRTALLIDPKSRDGLFLYGRACLDAYQQEDKSEDYVGNFKAESLEMFEMLTMIHSDYDMGYYFLGYGYVNLGLYTKAKLTWDQFMELTDGTSNREVIDLRNEISGRLTQLVEPVKIEQAINEVLRGSYQHGREVLLKYTDGKYSDWWPLWYYLGVCEESMGNADAAIADYKYALRYSPSNTDIMDQLAAVYEAVGDKTNADKYRSKIELVNRNIELEKQDNEL